MAWRAPDSPQNNKAFSRQKDTQYPQVRMICQMELSSHLITGSAFDDYKVSEMIIAEKLHLIIVSLCLIRGSIH